MKKYRYKFGNGLAHLENKDVQMMEDMAAEGYFLVKVGNLGFYKFEKAEGEICSYSIDFSDIKVNSQEFPQYKEIFEAGGWEYRCSCDSIHYFKAPKGTTPIYTDNASMAEKYETMRKWCVSFVVAGGIAAVVFGLLLSLTILHIPLAIAILLGALAGGSAGLSITMLQGMLINKRRAAKLRRGIDATAEDSAQETAETYEKRSRSCAWKLAVTILVVALAVMELFIFQGLPWGWLRIAAGGIMGGGTVCAIEMAWGVIKNKRKATQLREQ